MSLPEAIIPCAQIVEKGDADRFRTVMAAPLAARAKLFPLYAMNIEVSRAPWVTKEAMIAEMRLQWWRDALEEIAKDTEVRKHEVTTPLAEVLTQVQAQRLDESVAARRWDIYREGFEDQTHFDAYIDQTAGHLMWTACEALGADAAAETSVRDLANAAGTAAYLRAVPALAAEGRIPLLDGTDAGVKALAQRALDRMTRPKIAKTAQPALWPAIGAGKTLAEIVRDPGAVAEARLDPGISSFRLARTALIGRLAL